MLVNNACNPNEPNNIIKVLFSEPVRYTALLQNQPQNVTGLTLINAPVRDSLFMRSMIIDAASEAWVEQGMETDLSLWNFDQAPDRMMNYKMRVLPVCNASFTVGNTRIRFSVDPANQQFTDVNGISACGSANQSVVLVGLESKTHVCALTGPTVVNRNDAVILNWKPSDDPNDHGELVPAFPFFGFVISSEILNNPAMQNTLIRPQGTLPGSGDFIVLDSDPNRVLVSTDVLIFDLFGNLTASPASHKTLGSRYTVEEIRSLMGIDDAMLSSLDTMDLESIDNNPLFRVDSARVTWEPDTVRPVYPGTIQINFEYLKRMCGPSSGKPVCVPAWNCLNAKGDSWRPADTSWSSISGPAEKWKPAIKNSSSPTAERDLSKRERRDTVAAIVRPILTGVARPGNR
jgi:hypothetical protein